MKKLNILILISLLCIVSNIFSKAVERLFYVTNDVLGDSLLSNSRLDEIKAHAGSIDIIAPQIYLMNENGKINGCLDPGLLKFTKAAHIKVMPLIVNFNQKSLDALFHHSTATLEATKTLLQLCQRYHLYGVQLDFENMNAKDKDSFTQFVQAVAAVLHQHGFVISVAVTPPMNTDESKFSAYTRWYYENWVGAYDYQKLAKAANFITVMTYDRHTSLTTPGPIAPIQWVDEIVQSLLKTVPPEKISLGIGVYSAYWATQELEVKTDKSNPLFGSKRRGLRYSDVGKILVNIKKVPIWDDQSKSSYVINTPHGLYEYLFIEDARSFKERLNLSKHYHLRGISVWQLQFEDPLIWKTLE